MRKNILLTVGVVLILLLGAAVAQAITYGEPDGHDHPNVGILAADFGGGTGVAGFCSGTLIAPDVFLTAGHCVAFLPDLKIEEVFVSFDPEFDSDSQLHSGSYELHPGYGASFAHFNDLAVVLLDEPVPETITPARLPPAGFLDDLGPRGLKGQHFTAVGYGVTEPTLGGGPPLFDGFGIRRVSVSSFYALIDQWLHLSQNDATGDAGTCFGDSGGPNFFGAGDGETTMVASVTSTGDAMCLATNTTYRVDTPEARAFLGNFVTLP